LEQLALFINEDTKEAIMKILKHTSFLKLLFENNIYILHTFLLLMKKTKLKLDMN
jgi:hypothetical protein